MKYLNAPSRAVRRLVPGILDVTPHPEGNFAESYQFDAAWDRAWWGFILHAYRTHNHQEAWALFDAETDATSERI